MSELKENEPGIVWCKPWGEGQGDYVRVNVSDFDPAVHELLDADQAPKRGRKQSSDKAD